MGSKQARFNTTKSVLVIHAFVKSYGMTIQTESAKSHSIYWIVYSFSLSVYIELLN